MFLRFLVFFFFFFEAFFLSIFGPFWGSIFFMTYVFVLKILYFGGVSL